MLTRKTPLKQRKPMARGKPLKAKAPTMRAKTTTAPPRAAMKARKKGGKKPPKTVYRNPAMLAQARGEPCLLLIPDNCWGGTGTTVSCHSNRLRDGKGKGIKAHDWATAFGCGGCHFFLDKSFASRAVKESYFEAGLRRTRDRRMTLGLWPEEAERGFQLNYGTAE